jgi:hypothetical protein
MPDELQNVYTRLPLSEYRKLERAAKAENLSIAAHVRRVLIADTKRRAASRARAKSKQEPAAA